MLLRILCNFSIQYFFPHIPSTYLPILTSQITLTRSHSIYPASEPGEVLLADAIVLLVAGIDIGPVGFLLRNTY